MHTKSSELKNLSLVPDSTKLFSLTSCTLTLPYLIFNPYRTTHTLLTSAGTCFSIPVRLFIYFVKMLNQNPAQYTRECTTQLTHIPKYRPFSPKQPIVNIWRTCLIPFKTCFDHSSRFDSPTLYSNISFQVTPALSRGPEIGQLHFVCIYSQLWFKSIYSLTTSNCPWNNPVGWIQSVFLEPIMNQPDLYPANLQTTINLSSYTPDVETTFEDNSLTKLSRAIIFKSIDSS